MKLKNVSHERYLKECTFCEHKSFFNIIVGYPAGPTEEETKCPDCGRQCKYKKDQTGFL